MHSIVFHPRSRKVKPHWDEYGDLHVCVSEWDKVLIDNGTDGTDIRKAYKMPPRQRRKYKDKPKHVVIDPTNGTPNNSTQPL